jgi:hypothetical protein
MSWRLLEPGETILPGDEWWSIEHHNWRPISWCDKAKLGEGDNPHRRRMPEQVTVTLDNLDLTDDQMKAMLVCSPPLQSGRDALWEAFGLGRASWLTMPRVFMHAMPDAWQTRMAALIREWDAEWSYDRESPLRGLGIPIVLQRNGGKFTRWPEYVLNYRHPDRHTIERCRR